MTKQRTKAASPVTVPRGVRFGKTWGLLTGLVLAMLIAVPGFFWVNSMWDKELRDPRSNGVTPRRRPSPTADH